MSVSIGDTDDAWNADDRVAYKKAKGHAFVDRGYSVEWSPDVYSWMAVYLPERFERQRPQIRADVKFYREPSSWGIDGGRISKLSIESRWNGPLDEALGRPSRATLLYNYDRGLDVDKLKGDREGHRLFLAIKDELN